MFDMVDKPHGRTQGRNKIDQCPPAATALARPAYGHFPYVTEENRRFWTLVALETDNTGEWVPNDHQVSGLGLTMPPGTGDRWQAVLADAEKLLKGEVLIPHLSLIHISEPTRPY